MGCGGSVLGCCPELSLPSPNPQRGTAAAAATTDNSSPPQLRPLSLQRDGGPRRGGLEPEPAVGVAGDVAAGGTASGLRYGSAAAAALSTEELASGRSQLERGYQQLPLGVPLKEWDDLHVRMWLLTLPPVLRPYTDMLCSPGGLLVEWNDELLSEAGVSNVFHRKQLLEYVRQLQADVAARLQQQHQQQSESLLAPAGVLPGSIDSPRGGGSSSGGGKLLRSGAADSDSVRGSHTPARSASLRRLRSAGNSNPGSAPYDGDDGDDVDATSSSRGGKAGGGGEAAAANRVSKDGADRLAEYEQGRLEQGVAALKLLVLEAGAMCPWPGNAAAELLASLLDMGERALINRRNWQQLNTRAVDLLQLIANNKRLQADTHSYGSLMHRLINTLKGIREYFTDFTNRNWLSRVVGVGRDQHMFTQLWNGLGALVADASLGLQVAAAGGQEVAAAVLERLQKRQARYDDEEGRLRQRIEELGGVEALVRDPGQLLQVASSLGVGDQLTLHKIQEAVGLLEADRSEGVHSLIPHPDLRVLWRKCFSSLQDVSWALWWEAFPAELGRVPVEQLVIAALSSRLSDPPRRAAFERRLDLSSAGRLSVVDLRRTVPADADLREAVAQLTERFSMDGTADLDAGSGTALRTSSSPGNLPPPAAAAAAAAIGDSGTAAAAAVAAPPAPATPPASPAPYTSLEPRCSLPPLDSDRFVGREDDVRQISQILMAGSGAPRHSRRSSNAAGGVGGGGGGGGGGTLVMEGRSLSLSGVHRAHAVCVVAESGMGKSALAVAAARRLWESGCLPGGAYHVELQGADCRAEMAARFAGALGVAKAEHGDAAGTAGVSLALQALAARGPLLLVLDGVDCLDDMYDNFGSDSAAAADGIISNNNINNNNSIHHHRNSNSLNENADIDVGGNHDGGGTGGGLGGAELDAEPEAALSELLAVVPSARVLLTSTEPLELRSREVEYFWLGPLPEPAGVALVQDLARCLTWDEARQLVAACGLSPLTLRLAASAVAAGALTLLDAISRARHAAATLAAFTTRGAWSPGGSGGAGLSPSTSGGAVPPGSGGGPPGRGAVGPSGPSVLVPITPRLLRSQSPLAAAMPTRYRSPQTPSGRSGAAAAAAAAAAVRTAAVATAQTPYGFTQYFADGSTAGEGSSAPADSPSPTGRDGGGAAGGYGTYGTPSSALTPSPSKIRNTRANTSFARSMSFLLRTSLTTGGVGGGNGGGGAAAAVDGGGSSPPLLQPTFSSGRAGSGTSGRTYGSGAAVAAALLAALSDEHRTALVQLSIMPGSWDEDTASALLGQPPYAVRALLDVLVGYSLVVSRGCSGGRRSSSGGAGPYGGGGGSLNATMGGYGQGCYSLMPGVLDSARAQLAELDSESRVALQCRFVGHVLSQFLRADRLYRAGAVRAAMQLASELRQDVQAMLLVAAKCADPDRMLWGTIGATRLPALAASPLFSALVLDASAEMDAFWRAVGEAAVGEAAEHEVEAAAAGTGTAEAAVVATEARRDAAAAALAARALAATLHKQARYEEAEAAWRGALLQAQRIHGASSLESAACHCGLGLALSALRRYGEAEEQHSAALRLRKAALGDRHVDVASSLSDLARVMRNTGRYKKAEEAYAEVLQVRRELLGDDHPAVADSYNSAGIAAGLQKRYLEEEHFYRKALAIRQRTLGPDHPEVAQALNNIGTALSSQGRHAAAEQVFRDSLAIKRKVLGPSHHAVGTTLNNIARALRYQAKLPEAEAACRQALAVLEGSLGATHPSVTTAVSNLVYLLKRQGKETEATTVYQAYRPRWTQDRVQPGPGDVMGQPRGEAAVEADGGGGATGTPAATVSPPSRPGRPPLAPLAPQGSGRTPPPLLSPPPLLRKQQQEQERQHGQGKGRAPRPQSDLDAALSVMAAGPGALQGGAEGLGSGAAGGRGGGGRVFAAPPQLESRLDASSLHRQVLVEAARAAQREMQGCEAAATARADRRGSGSGVRPKTSGALDGRTSSTTLVTDFAPGASAAGSSVRESDSDASAVATSVQEMLSTNGTDAIVKLSGTIPPRPYTASPVLSGSTNGFS